MGFSSLDVFIYEMKHQTHTALTTCCFPTLKLAMPLAPVSASVDKGFPSGGAVPAWVISSQALKVIMRKLQIAVLVPLQHKSWDNFCSENASILSKICQVTIFWGSMVWSVLNQPSLNQWCAGWMGVAKPPSPCMLCWTTWCMQTPQKYVQINIKNLLKK